MSYKYSVYQSLLSLALFFSYNTIKAQSNEGIYDSLRTVYSSQKDNREKFETLDALYNSTRLSLPNEAQKYSLEQLELARVIGYKKGEGIANTNLGNYFMVISERDSSLFYFNKALSHFTTQDSTEIIKAQKGIAITKLAQGDAQGALEITEKNIDFVTRHKDTSMLASFYNFKGGIYNQLGLFEKSYESVLKSLELNRAIDNKLGIADALYSLATSETVDSNHNRSIEFLTEALDIYKEFNDLYYQTLTESAIGFHYFKIGDYERSIQFSLGATSDARKLNSPDIEALAYRTIGEVYIAQGNIQEGINTYQKAAELFNVAARRLDHVQTLNDLSKGYYTLGDPVKALKSANQAVFEARQLKAPPELALALRNKFLAEKALGSFKNALTTLEAQKQLSDSIYTIERKKQVEQLRATFDTERKERQIKQQQSDIELLERKKQVDTLQKLGLIIGVVGLAIILGLSIFSFREKRKRATAEHEKLQISLKSRQKELTTYALQMAKKNEVLEGLRNQAETLKTTNENNKGFQDIIRTINFDLQDDNNWEDFSKYFEQVHGGFYERIKLKYPSVTTKELRLLALLKMNLSSKEMANVLNISPEGIKKARYRLRKKLDVTTESSLNDFVMTF